MMVTALVLKKIKSKMDNKNNLNFLIGNSPPFYDCLKQYIKNSLGRRRICQNSFIFTRLNSLVGSNARFLVDAGMFE